MKYFICLLTIILISFTAYAGEGYIAVPPRDGALATAADFALVSTGFRFIDATFDSRPDAQPRIPKTWKFIAVSNSAQLNVNNLWFQDTEGKIYLIQVMFNQFSSFKNMFLKDNIHVINSK
jgi:hypothetical protein